MKKRNTAFGAAAIVALANLVSATADAATIIKNIICSLIPEVMTLAWALAFLVFIYGGAKYAFGADDPGARKQGKNIAINAMIGFIIIAASQALIAAIAFSGGAGTICP